jgi:hypothetical protein
MVGRSRTLCDCRAPDRPYQVVVERKASVSVIRHVDFGQSQYGSGVFGSRAVVCPTGA